MKRVRVRYAPSPTGHLHIGGARTALFNYLFAKHHKGDFIVRIEDTDIDRNVPGGEQSQLDNLAWLGIHPDESPRNPGDCGPYRQTEKLDIYRDYANQLIESGHAYECFCTPEEIEASKKKQEAEGQFSYRYDGACRNLTEEQKEAYHQEGRKAAIRFKVDQEAEYKWDDIVRGETSFIGKDISDWVIIKGKDGVATYNFAVVVDDVQMSISHIFRGEEHISNTPKQLMVYEALKQEPPLFGHLSLIVNEERKKLSKRDETIMQFVSQYKDEGYIPEAMFNFFALLGWSPVGEEEIFTEEQLAQQFDSDRFSKSPSMFDKKKLNWINNEYINKLDDEQYKALVVPFIEKNYDISNKDNQWLMDLINLFKPQLSYGQEIVELVKPYFTDKELSSEQVDFLKENNSKEVLSNLKDKLSNLDDFNVDSIKEAIKQAGKESNVKGKQLFMPVRIAISKEEHGGDLATVILLYTKEGSVSNLEKAIELL